MTFYYKLTGYNQFYRVSGIVEKSNRGHIICRITECEPITKYYYYEKAAPCFSMIAHFKPGDYIHKFAYGFLPWPKNETEEE